VPDLKAIGARIRRWRENICQFVHEELHVETIDDWQREALEAFASEKLEDQRICTTACVGPGKSAFLAWCGLWFLGTQGARGEHPKGAAVAVTETNLRDNLWSEVSKFMSRSPYLSTAFAWTASRIVARDHDDWFLSARTYPQGGDPTEQGKTLSGLHSKYVFALIDEAGTIPVTVLRAAEQALSNCTFGKIAIAGNPISTEGMLYAAATQLRHQWRIIVVTGDPDDLRRSPRVDLAWAKEAIATYGRDNPWVQSYILGRFPSHSFNALLSIDDVEAAMHRHLRGDQFSFAQRRIGCDIARFGDDATCLFPRQGLAAFKPVMMRGARTNEIAARIGAAVAAWGPEAILVDDSGGWGAGVIDHLMLAGTPAIPVNFAGAPTDPRYKNKRAEMWFELAAWVKRGGSLPPIAELVADLTTPVYSFNGGKFVLRRTKSRNASDGRLIGPMPWP
jgi:hypothetical protein